MTPSEQIRLEAAREGRMKTADRVWDLVVAQVGSGKRQFMTIQAMETAVEEYEKWRANFVGPPPSAF